MSFTEIKRQYTASPLPQYGLSGSILVGSLLNSGRRGIPSPLVGALYAAAFGYTGSLAQKGNRTDATLASTAWSLAYTASYLGRTLRPVPLLLAVGTGANLVFHGSDALFGIGNAAV